MAGSSGCCAALQRRVLLAAYERPTPLPRASSETERRVTVRTVLVAFILAITSCYNFAWANQPQQAPSVMPPSSEALVPMSEEELNRDLIRAQTEVQIIMDLLENKRRGAEVMGTPTNSCRRPNCCCQSGFYGTCMTPQACYEVGGRCVARARGC